ncbi:MAG: flagellar basal body rod protein FlgC [Alphaproteobacteria bacterium]
MINAIGIALTGLNSASQRLNASASNIANVSTAGSLVDPASPPYTPVTTKSKALGTTGGVQTNVIPQQAPFTPAFDPDSPFADENGFIGVPNVDLAEEAVNIKLAEISYKANLSTIKVAGELFDELLETFDKK